MWIDVASTPDLSKLYYFAYGSDLLKEQMKHICRRSSPFCLGVLKDHKLMFKKVATVESRKGSEVSGMLYKISKSDLKSLHLLKGYPKFSDVRIGLVNTANSTVKAFWYETPKSDLSLPPSCKYIAKMAAGYAEWDMDTNSLYSAVVRCVWAVKARKRKQIKEEIKYLGGNSDVQINALQ